jgi:hypothetical protein
MLLYLKPLIEIAVLTGRMNGTVFETSQMQVKCPIKYEPET